MAKGTKRPDPARRTLAGAAEKRAQHLLNYEVDKTTGCWNWKGGVSQDGYGKLKRFKKTFRAHRVFYKEHKGDIPEGLWVLHSCDNTLCVNPDHLRVGTQLDNERDKDERGRRPPSPSITHPHLMPKGEQVFSAKLKNTDVCRIKISKESAKDLAKLFSLYESTIHRIRSGKTWKHITVDILAYDTEANIKHVASSILELSLEIDLSEEQIYNALQEGVYKVNQYIVCFLIDKSEVLKTLLSM